MQIHTILTHPGGAHKDDLLACAVLLSQAPVAIERRNPHASDLEDAGVAVVDIGHCHDSEQLNFDHHQFPAEATPSCALSLVLQHLGLYEDARNFCSWLETSEWLDCRGPKDTAEWLGIGRDVLGQLNSPIDITLLRRFAAQERHLPGEPLWELLRMVGEDLVTYLTQLRKRLDFVAEHAEIWEIESDKGSFKALFMPRTEPLPQEASAGLAQHIISLGLEAEIQALIYPDSRGEGYGLRRFNDSLKLDFTKLEKESDVHFTHARGFIAKTCAAEPNRLRTLLSAAFEA
jgi:hypothetical protein